MIEVGEYIRTTEGCIVKINNDEHLDFLRFSNAVIGDIVNHSKKLIELVERKDIITYTKWGEEKTEKVLDVGNKCVMTWKNTIYDDELISILTHEMYEQNCYKVGED